MNVRIFLAVAVGLLAGQLFGQDREQPAPLELKTLKQKASYSIGLNIGSNLAKQSLDIDVDAVRRGFTDGFGGKKALLTTEEIEKVMAQFAKDYDAKQAETARVEGEKNLKEGKAFLTANKSKAGVKTLPSGLQYKVIREGRGKKPTATDTVVTHYRGTFINGKEFDSSYARKEPASFPVNAVIPGWTEALQLMPVGSHWQLFIPSELAYGKQGREGIYPNSTLIFELELLKIGQAEELPPEQEQSR